MYTLITAYTKGFVVETGSHNSLKNEFESRKGQEDIVAMFFYDSDGDLLYRHTS